MDTPSPLLTDFFPLFPKGRVLDIAMGRGRNALFFAENGYEVDGVDIDPEAVRVALARAQERGLVLKAMAEDIQKCTFPQGRYDLVLCFYFLERELIPRIRETVKLGGMVVYETYLIDQHLLYGKPQHREYCLEHNELLYLFRGFRILYYREGFLEERKAIAQLIAQRG